MPGGRTRSSIWPGAPADWGPSACQNCAVSEPGIREAAGQHADDLRRLTADADSSRRSRRHARRTSAAMRRTSTTATGGSRASVLRASASALRRGHRRVVRRGKQPSRARANRERPGRTGAIPARRRDAAGRQWPRWCVPSRWRGRGRPACGCAAFPVEEISADETRVSSSPGNQVLISWIATRRSEIRDSGGAHHGGGEAEDRRVQTESDRERRNSAGGRAGRRASCRSACRRPSTARRRVRAARGSGSRRASAPRDATAARAASISSC